MYNPGDGHLTMHIHTEEVEPLKKMPSAVPYALGYLVYADFM